MKDALRNRIIPVITFSTHAVSNAVDCWNSLIITTVCETVMRFCSIYQSLVSQRDSNDRVFGYYSQCGLCYYALQVCWGLSVYAIDLYVGRYRALLCLCHNTGSMAIFECEQINRKIALIRHELNSPRAPMTLRAAVLLITGLRVFQFKSTNNF